MQSLWECLGLFFEYFPYSDINIMGIGAAGLRQIECQSGMTIDLIVTTKICCTKFYTCNIFEV
ncbi:hypothetical protein D3C72_2082930 [compost metagenome]